MKNIFLCFLIYLPLSFSYAEDYDWKAITRSEKAQGTNVTGKIVPRDGALAFVAARVQGRVLAIAKREGDKVLIGMPLYEISSTECFSLVQEKQVAAAKKIKELLESLEEREKHLGLKLVGNKCFAVATAQGIFTKRNLELGAPFNQGDIIGTVVDTSRLTIELDISEKDLTHIKVGQTGVFQLASSPGQTFAGKIATIVPAIDPITRTSKTRISAVKLPDHTSVDSLVFGTIVTGEIDTLLTVSSSALVFAHNRHFVIAGGNGKPTPVEVKVVKEMDSMSAIRPSVQNTLKEGDLVATHGAIFLLKRLNGDSNQ